jgi:hypothetical protein
LSSELHDVSCTSIGACTAVGFGSVSPRSLILRGEHGTTWTRARTPVEFGEWFTNGVACTSVNRCTAVGWRGFSPTILRTEDGVTWTAPDPAAEIAERRFEAVSCPRPRKCIAVGTFRPQPSDPPRALIMRET